jgi:hypothetical protein
MTTPFNEAEKKAIITTAIKNVETFRKDQMRFAKYQLREPEQNTMKLWQESEREKKELADLWEGILNKVR